MHTDSGVSEPDRADAVQATCPATFLPCLHSYKQQHLEVVWL